MSDAETKAAAEAQGKSWFKFTYVEEIKKGRAKGGRVEAAGTITREEAQAIFKILFAKTRKSKKKEAS